MRRKLADNLKRVRERMHAACQRARRAPEAVRLIAVTKMVEVDVIRSLIDMGVGDLAESRAQELVKRAGMVNEFLTRRRKLDPADGPPEPRWHMIGHMQRNKVRMVQPWVELIHSVDSLRLAEEISEESGKLGRPMDVLIEVNVAGEKSKHGIAVGAVPHLAEHIRALPGLRITGLMTMAPLEDDPEEVRPHFRRLRELFEEMRGEKAAGPAFCELSMGMTNDFEIAIEEGATLIRIGRALFDGVS
jgi:pyridoxal phosphate enzyme (YggS family)